MGPEQEPPNLQQKQNKAKEEFLNNVLPWLEEPVTILGTATTWEVISSWIGRPKEVVPRFPSTVNAFLSALRRCSARKDTKTCILILESLTSWGSQTNWDEESFELLIDGAGFGVAAITFFDGHPDNHDVAVSFCSIILEIFYPESKLPRHAEVVISFANEAAKRLETIIKKILSDIDDRTKRRPDKAGKVLIEEDRSNLLAYALDALRNLIFWGSTLTSNCNHLTEDQKDSLEVCIIALLATLTSTCNHLTEERLAGVLENQEDSLEVCRAVIALRAELEATDPPLHPRIIPGSPLLEKTIEVLERFSSRDHPHAERAELVNRGLLLFHNFIKNQQSSLSQYSDINKFCERLLHVAKRELELDDDRIPENFLGICYELLCIFSESNMEQHLLTLIGEKVIVMMKILMQKVHRGQSLVEWVFHLTWNMLQHSYPSTGMAKGGFFAGTAEGNKLLGDAMEILLAAAKDLHQYLQTRSAEDICRLCGNIHYIMRAEKSNKAVQSTGCRLLLLMISGRKEVANNICTPDFINHLSWLAGEVVLPDSFPILEALVSLMDDVMIRLLPLMSDSRKRLGIKSDRALIHIKLKLATKLELAVKDEDAKDVLHEGAGKVAEEHARLPRQQDSLRNMRANQQLLQRPQNSAYSASSASASRASPFRDEDDNNSSSSRKVAPPTTILELTAAADGTVSPPPVAALAATTPATSLSGSSSVTVAFSTTATATAAATALSSSFSSSPMSTTTKTTTSSPSAATGAAAGDGTTDEGATTLESLGDAQNKATADVSASNEAVPLTAATHGGMQDCIPHQQARKRNGRDDDYFLSSSCLKTRRQFHAPNPVSLFSRSDTLAASKRPRIGSGSNDGNLSVATLGASLGSLLGTARGSLHLRSLAGATSSIFCRRSEGPNLDDPNLTAVTSRPTPSFGSGLENMFGSKANPDQFETLSSKGGIFDDADSEDESMNAIQSRACQGLVPRPQDLAASSATLVAERNIGGGRFDDAEEDLEFVPPSYASVAPIEAKKPLHHPKSAEAKSAGLVEEQGSSDKTTPVCQDIQQDGPSYSGNPNTLEKSVNIVGNEKDAKAIPSAATKAKIAAASAIHHAAAKKAPPTNKITSKPSTSARANDASLKEKTTAKKPPMKIKGKKDEEGIKPKIKRTGPKPGIDPTTGAKNHGDGPSSEAGMKDQYAGIKAATVEPATKEKLAITLKDSTLLLVAPTGTKSAGGAMVKSPLQGAEGEENRQPKNTRARRKKVKEPGSELAPIKTPAGNARKRKAVNAEQVKRARSHTADAEEQQDAKHDDEIVILCTGVALTNPQKNIIKKLGFKIVEEVKHAHTATHVIVRDKKKKVSMKRTPKLMIGLCNTTNIVDMAWLTESGKANKPLPVDDFLLVDDKILHRAAEMKDKGTKVLSGWSIHVRKGATEMPLSELKMVVEQAGGIWQSSLSQKAVKDLDLHRFLVITSDPDTERDPKVNELTSLGARTRTAAWLFDQVLKQEVSITQDDEDVEQEGDDDDDDDDGDDGVLGPFWKVTQHQSKFRFEGKQFEYEFWFEEQHEESKEGQHSMMYRYSMSSMFQDGVEETLKNVKKCLVKKAKSAGAADVKKRALKQYNDLNALLLGRRNKQITKKNKQKGRAAANKPQGLSRMRTRRG